MSKLAVTAPATFVTSYFSIALASGFGYSSAPRKMRPLIQRGGRSRMAACSGWLAGLFVVLALLLAASPQVHQLIHHHDDAHQHECLACTLQKGGCEAVGAAIVVVRSLGESCSTVPVLRAECRGSFFLSCRRLEHAPPRLLVSQLA